MNESMMFLCKYVNMQISKLNLKAGPKRKTPPLTPDAADAAEAVIRHVAAFINVTRHRYLSPPPFLLSHSD